MKDSIFSLHWALRKSIFSMPNNPDPNILQFKVKSTPTVSPIVKFLGLPEPLQLYFAQAMHPGIVEGPGQIFGRDTSPVKSMFQKILQLKSA